ncbi:MAG TPA: cytochrome c oxidase subunit II [Chloroflexota bacterium]|nr:cytochrome c oxidase subunit II [Chloroflexota bacterium]HUM70598.1 cytochrome c oxidase subunit II [Chloroflexota bacterium]
MRKYRHALAVFVLTILSTIGLYILFRFFLYRFPSQASAEAVVIDNFADIHFWLQAFLFGLIMVIMLYAVFAFRRQPDDESEGPHVHGHTGLEIIWTIVPTAVVIGFAIYSVGILNDLLAPNPGERTIEVVGRQWSWKFVYPDIEDKSGTELGLLVNEPVVLHMWAEDVIHSFWVPEFRVKQDLLPVQNSKTDYYVLRFTPTEEGEFKVRCAEICGLQHSQMFATVRVMNQADYAAWAAEIASKPSLDELEGMTAEARGEFWYTEFGCNGCHSLDGSAMAGPTWLNVVGKEEQLTDGSTIIVDDAYLYESILNPNAKIVAGFNPGIMPQNFEDQFNNFGWGDADQITNDLIAFIKTVTDDTTASSE